MNACNDKSASLSAFSNNLSSETLNSKEQTAEKIIEGTEKSLFDLAERGSFSQSFLKFNQALDQTIEMATLAMKNDKGIVGVPTGLTCLLYTSPSPRDRTRSRMPSSA